MAVDDELDMAAQLLLRDRFVLREEDPEGFFLVRRHERALRERRISASRRCRGRRTMRCLRARSRSSRSRMSTGSSC